ncbi:MAG TPA: adenylate/guanylate cyclase domain-containing protein [Telluria sp.]|nr:adenylate/guanylate cyclase domain-containing protein [Telluria sp.]
MTTLHSPARSRWRFSSRLVRTAIALTALLLAFAAEWTTTPTVSFFANEWLRDAFVRLQATNAPEPRVLVVDIDEASLARIGKWPWSRARLADLVEVLLTRYEARGVALDIVLDDPLDAAGDRRLALLAENGPVVLAQAFDFQEGERPEVLHKGVLAAPSPRYRSGGLPATGYVANHAGLARAAQVGNVGFKPDRDGTLRQVPLLTSYGGQRYEALSLALLNCCSGRPPLVLPDAGLARVSYRRDWTAYTVVSALDILDPKVFVEGASKRLVLVGSSSIGLGDRVATPIAASRPGLSVQAAMLSDLLDRQDGLTPAPWPGRLLACLFAALSVGATMAILPRRSATLAVAVLLASSALWIGAAYALSRHDPVFSTTGPLLANLFLLAVAVPYQWQQTQRRSRHLLDTLRQYVAPKVVDQLLESGLEDPLKPRQLDVTTLIADMEGYTTQVESLPVEEAAELTRVFLDCLTAPVIALGGTLDKYTGDGLVAFWGAPLPQENHADLALDAAREITRRVHILSRQREALGFPPLRVRIGIDSGPAMAGDFGTSFRSIYTAVGDSVNTASRLEQAARDFTHNVIVGAGTVERARRHRFLLLGERTLRGKLHPTTLFTLDPGTMEVPGSTTASASAREAAR